MPPYLHKVQLACCLANREKWLRNPMSPIPECLGRNWPVPPDATLAWRVIIQITLAACNISDPALPVLGKGRFNAFSTYAIVVRASCARNLGDHVEICYVHI